jgi:hypothetical protein
MKEVIGKRFYLILHIRFVPKYQNTTMGKTATRCLTDLLQTFSNEYRAGKATTKQSLEENKGQGYANRTRPTHFLISFLGIANGTATRNTVVTGTVARTNT